MGASRFTSTTPSKICGTGVLKQNILQPRHSTTTMINTASSKNAAGLEHIVHLTEQHEGSCSVHAAEEFLALRCINRGDQYPGSKWVITVYLHARFISYFITNHSPPEVLTNSMARIRVSTPHASCSSMAKCIVVHPGRAVPNLLHCLSFYHDC